MAFEPTQDMIDAAQRLFAAQAVFQIVEPIVREYQARILTEHQWHTAERFQQRLGDRVITEPKETYLMDPADFAIYDQECRKARDAAGLIVEDDEFCPLCVAETDRAKAEFALIDALAPATGLTTARLRTAKPDDRARAVRLACELMAPFVPARAGADDFEFSRIKLREVPKSARRSAAPGF